MPRPATARRTKDVTINLRAAEDQRDLIDRAARGCGQTRTEFILDAACREAQEQLLDNPRIVVDPEAFDRFTEMLDAPPNPSEALRKTMNLTPPWK